MRGSGLQYAEIELQVIVCRKGCLDKSGHQQTALPHHGECLILLHDGGCCYASEPSLD